MNKGPEQKKDDPIAAATEPVSAVTAPVESATSAVTGMAEQGVGKETKVQGPGGASSEASQKISSEGASISETHKSALGEVGGSAEVTKQGVKTEMSGKDALGLSSGSSTGEVSTDRIAASGQRQMGVARAGGGAEVTKEGQVKSDANVGYGAAELGANTEIGPDKVAAGASGGVEGLATASSNTGISAEKGLESQSSADLGAASATAGGNIGPDNISANTGASLGNVASTTSSANVTATSVQAEQGAEVAGLSADVKVDASLDKAEATAQASLDKAQDTIDSTGQDMQEIQNSGASAEEQAGMMGTEAVIKAVETVFGAADTAMEASPIQASVGFDADKAQKSVTDSGLANEEGTAKFLQKSTEGAGPGAENLAKGAGTAITEHDATAGANEVVSGAQENAKKQADIVPGGGEALGEVSQLTSGLTGGGAPEGGKPSAPGGAAGIPGADILQQGTSLGSPSPASGAGLGSLGQGGDALGSVTKLADVGGMGGAAPEGGKPSGPGGGMPGGDMLGSVTKLADVGGMGGAAPEGGKPGGPGGGMPGGDMLGSVTKLADVGGMGGAAPEGGKPGGPGGGMPGGDMLGSVTKLAGGLGGAEGGGMPSLGGGGAEGPSEGKSSGLGALGGRALGESVAPGVGGEIGSKLGDAAEKQQQGGDKPAPSKSGGGGPEQILTSVISTAMKLATGGMMANDSAGQNVPSGPEAGMASPQMLTQLTGAQNAVTSEKGMTDGLLSKAGAGATPGADPASPSPGGPSMIPGLDLAMKALEPLKSLANPMQALDLAKGPGQPGGAEPEKKKKLGM